MSTAATLSLNSTIRSRPVRTLALCARQFSTTPVFSKATTERKGKGVRPTNAQGKRAAEPKKKLSVMYKTYDLRPFEQEQLSLCDAMRYIRAFEVGRNPTSPKYECHVRIKTRRNGPVIRNMIRMPHSVKSNIRICVICPPDSPIARQAREAGAALVGEEEVFELVKAGKIDFERCIAHPDSLQKIAKAGLPRILGPRGLMPNIKLGTVVENPANAIRTLLGGSMYRERDGVVQMSVGQLGLSPEQLRDNIQAFLGKMKEDAGKLSHLISKQIAEVVLSSTNAPGFSLNGDFKSENSPPTKDLSG